MSSLQSVLEDWLQDVPIALLADVIEEKLAHSGVNTSRRNIEFIASRIVEGDTDSIRLNRWRIWERKDVDLTFTEDDEAAIESQIDAFIESIPDILETVRPTIAEQLKENLEKLWKNESRIQSHEIKGFRNRLYNEWRVPIEKLKMLLAIAIENGASVNKTLRESPGKNKEALIEALTRSHARACQIANEVIHLIEGGFADGALARWRSLHEAVVVAMFISRHGEMMAARYLDHEVVESMRGLKEYMGIYQRIGYEEVSSDEYAGLQREYSKVVRRYEKEFERAYGWAADPKWNMNPKFADIERSVDMDYLRGHYRMASHGVHANPKSITFSIGLSGNDDVLLAGPSNTGFADPGHLCALAITQISGVLFNMVPILDNFVALDVMSIVSDEIGQSLLGVQKGLSSSDH